MGEQGRRGGLQLHAGSSRTCLEWTQPKANTQKQKRRCGTLGGAESGGRRAEQGKERATGCLRLPVLGDSTVAGSCRQPCAHITDTLTAATERKEEGQEA